MIFTINVIAISLGITLTAFTISTIVLAVQKSQLTNDLNDANVHIEALEGMLKQTTTTTTTTSIISTTTTTEPIPSPDIDYRLPKSLKPIHYDLYLHPDIDNGNFSGKLVITIDCQERTNQIVLHSLNITIITTKLIGLEKEAISIENVSQDMVREFLIIELNQSVPADRQFQLDLTFEGSMLNKIVGLYSSSYLKENGSRKWVATSKFEPTYARQAFPCFDEPALKATFQVTLIHPNDGDYHALSNMDVAFEEKHELYTEVHFNISVPMSTYLACFIVSDFKYKSTTINTSGIGDEFELRVFATSEQLHKVNFALDVGKKVIEYYINYFRLEYPLPKLDMAAIPDFVSGAMEHWGLVTYRETSLLYDKDTSSTVNKQRVAAVIAHEFAHMWFGNLVTMKWWNDLWLNEGFAKYIEHKGVDAVFPEWKMQDQFITGTLHDVLKLDATLASHPIIQPVTNPDQITEIFDTITYSKGSSIIRMLEDFLGADNFRQAVINYLNEYKFGNAVTDDFLTEIAKLNKDIDVKGVMRTWLEQMGLPVIMIKPLESDNIQLTQKRFFSNPNDYNGVFNDTPFNYKWSVPITYITNENRSVQREWFYYNQDGLIISIPKTVKWVKFNCEQVGYYRVNYNVEMWNALSNELKYNVSTFSVADRASLLDDAFALADATQIPYDLALDMTKYLNNEFNYVPWNVATSKLISLKRKLLYTDAIRNYTIYTRVLIKPIYENVTWSISDLDEDHLRSRLRVVILNLACSLGLEECLIKAGQLFEMWLAEPLKRPHPDIREIVYYYGMLSRGNEINWEKMWQLFVAEQDANEKVKLMKGLAAAQEPALLNRYVQLAWNEEYVRGQDYFNCLDHIAANPNGESIVWDHVREHWPDLVDRFGLNERSLGNLIPTITRHFHTQTKVEEMEQFFDKYPKAGAGKAARLRAVETVKNNIVWLDNNLMAFRDWLKQNILSN